MLLNDWVLCVSAHFYLCSKCTFNHADLQNNETTISFPSPWSFFFDSQNYSKILISTCSRARIISLTPLKRLTICMFFFNLPDLQKPGRNRLPRKSCWVIKALGVLDQIISYIQFRWYYKENVNIFLLLLVVSYLWYIVICFYSFGKLFLQHFFKSKPITYQNIDWSDVSDL